MKSLSFLLAAAFALLLGCNNGDTAEENSDTGNTLTDTVAAPAPIDTVGIDSNPQDGTYVDTLIQSG